MLGFLQRKGTTGVGAASHAASGPFVVRSTPLSASACPSHGAPHAMVAPYDATDSWMKPIGFGAQPLYSWTASLWARAENNEKTRIAEVASILGTIFRRAEFDGIGRIEQSGIVNLWSRGDNSWVRVACKRCGMCSPPLYPHR